MHVIFWEFRVRPESVTAFESAYGKEGLWSSFFKKGKGYLRTELFEDIQRSGRYLTADYWVSPEAYEAFCREYAAEYKIIDLRCGRLTSYEAHVGSFFSP